MRKKLALLLAMTLLFGAAGKGIVQSKPERYAENRIHAAGG